jgi:flagellar biosynthesis/type III secretory pathway M-ring protein FliF/YscJ
MDVFKAQLAKIQQQLSGLTASQKMLSMALVAIMAMTVTWMARYAGQADMEPLLNQSFSADDVAQITSRLDARNIAYTVSGDRIMVPTDRKIEILADMQYSHLLPDRTNAAFDDMLKQMTPFDPADKTAQLWLQAKSQVLQQVIEKFPHVRDANVMIDPTDQRRFDGHDVNPTAMIYITTSGDEDSGDRDTRKIATAAADLVSGAQAGLARGNVTVVVDGTAVPIADKSADGGMPDGDAIVLEKQANEEMYRQKILKQYGFIRGLYVQVTVNLSTKQVVTDETVYDQKTTAHLSVSEEEHTNESTSPGGGAEPGAASNVTTNGQLAVGAGAGGGGGATSNEDETKTTYQNLPSMKVLHTIQNPGDAVPVSATVRVPRSYLIQTYKDLHGGADPDDAALDALMKEEFTNIRQEVKDCTGIASDDAVAVNPYDDIAVAAAISGSAAPATTSTVSLLVASHVREIGVGGLAAFSLFMMMMMVRKSAPAPVPAADVDAANDKAVQHLDDDVPLAGEVGEGGKTMDGMELDDEAVRTQQMIEQVSDMVTENPEAAANLVKRWLNRA